MKNTKFDKYQKKYFERFIKEKTLPIHVGQPDGLNNLKYHRLYLAHLGFLVSDIKGGFFHFIKFPRGWKKVVPDWGNNNWIYLLDKDKRFRATIFYKVISANNQGQYQVNSFINWMNRFIIRTILVNGHISSAVYDTNNIIYSTEKFPNPADKNEKSNIEKRCFNECGLWLKDNYPDWDNINAYWDVDVV